MFLERLASYAPDLSSRESTALTKYYNILIQHNAQYNLTAIRDEEGIVLKHFYDSILFHQALDLKPGSRVIDLGTGAGFPGLVLAILNPSVDFTLVDSVGKKVRFLQEVISALSLDNVTALQGRAEVLGQDPLHRERYDIAIARSVAYLPTLVEYLLPLVRVGGTMTATKEAPIEEELKKATVAIALLGGSLHRSTPYALPGMDHQRVFLTLSKVRTTPKRYPRKDGTPLKNPL